VFLCHIEVHNQTKYIFLVKFGESVHFLLELLKATWIYFPPRGLPLSKGDAFELTQYLFTAVNVVYQRDLSIRYTYCIFI